MCLSRTGKRWISVFVSKWSVFQNTVTINVVLIPPNCTDRLQPLDISVNKAAKEYLLRQFQSWYTQEVCAQLKGEKEKAPVDF